MLKLLYERKMIVTNYKKVYYCLKPSEHAYVSFHYEKQSNTRI